MKTRFKCWKEIQVCGGGENIDIRIKEEFSEGESRAGLRSRNKIKG